MHKGLTCDDHGGFSLYVLLLPRTFVEFLLAQRHLVRLDMPTLRVLKEKAQMTTDTDNSLVCTAAEAPEAELMRNRKARQRCPVSHENTIAQRPELLSLAILPTSAGCSCTWV